jgi:hypothetical protein
MLAVRVHSMRFPWLCKNPAVTDPMTDLAEFTSAVNRATMAGEIATATLDVEIVTMAATTTVAADRARVTAAIDVTEGCSTLDSADPGYWCVVRLSPPFHTR